MGDILPLLLSLSTAFQLLSLCFLFLIALILFTPASFTSLSIPQPLKSFLFHSCYFASSFFHSLIPPSPWLPAFFFVCCHSPFLLLSPNLSYTILLQLLFLSHIQWCFARPRLALWPRSWRHSVSPYIIDHQTTRAKMHIFIYLFLSNSIILDHRSWLFFLHLRHTVYPHRKQNIPEKSRSTMLF